MCMYFQGIRCGDLVAMNMQFLFFDACAIEEEHVVMVKGNTCSNVARGFKAVSSSSPRFTLKCKNKSRASKNADGRF